MDTNMNLSPEAYLKGFSDGYHAPENYPTGASYYKLNTIKLRYYEGFIAGQLKRNMERDGNSINQDAEEKVDSISYMVYDKGGASYAILKKTPFKQCLEFYLDGINSLREAIKIRDLLNSDVKGEKAKQ